MSKKLRITEVKELSSLIDNDRNILEGIDVSKLYVNSSKKINWKCENGHTFKETVNVIYRRKNKCFYCTGREVWSGENDLQTLYPEIAKEFDVEKNRIVINSRTRGEKDFEARMLSIHINGTHLRMKVYAHANQTMKKNAAARMENTIKTLSI